MEAAQPRMQPRPDGKVDHRICQGFQYGAHGVSEGVAGMQILRSAKDFNAATLEPPLT